MITEDYVSFETAKLLKEKGFNENTSVNYFIGDDKLRGCIEGEMIHHKRLDTDTHLIACPTLQMAMKWLRNKSMIIVIQPEYFNSELKCSDWGVGIWCDDNYEKIPGYFPTYEKAAETAIKYCLTNLL